jgi:hypothetical protein
LVVHVLLGAKVIQMIGKVRDSQCLKSA